MLKNVAYAIIAVVFTVAFGIWFAVENSKSERNNLTWGVSMALMLVSGVAFMFYGYNGMSNIRGGGNAAPVVNMRTNAPPVANMPSNMAGSMNAQPQAAVI